jgi:hypothetical protein
MAVKTIGTSANRDYATLAAWASYANALTLTGPEYGQCYNDGLISASATVALGGWSGGSSTNTVTLECAYGEGFNTHPNKGGNPLRVRQSHGVFVRSVNVTSNTLNITTGNFIMKDLQIQQVGAANTHLINCTAARPLTIRNCIFDSANQSTAINASGATIENVLLVARRGEGISNPNGVTRHTAVIAVCGGGFGTGLQGDSNLVQNCLVAFTTPNSYLGSAAAASTNNATTESSFAGTNYGTNGVVGVSAGDFVAYSDVSGAEDFRLSLRSKLRNAGVSAGSNVDIFGTPRV